MRPEFYLKYGTVRPHCPTFLLFVVHGIITFLSTSLEDIIIFFVFVCFVVILSRWLLEQISVGWKDFHLNPLVNGISEKHIEWGSNESKLNFKYSVFPLARL